MLLIGMGLCTTGTASTGSPGIGGRHAGEERQRRARFNSEAQRKKAKAGVQGKACDDQENLSNQPLPKR